LLKWKIEFDAKAQSELLKLDKEAQRRVVDFLENRLIPRGNPKSLGEPLKGGLAGLWRYRVGDYRLICKIEDKSLTIIALSIGHRREVYKVKKL